jgi:PilZ domain
MDGFAVYQQRTPIVGLHLERQMGCYAGTMKQEQRGLRFPFNAPAEVTLENSTEKIPARVLELSLQGCFLEVSSLRGETQRLNIKIWHSDEIFEASAKILYVRATGVGLIFLDVKPNSRRLLQAWILAALDDQVKLEHT